MALGTVSITLEGTMSRMGQWIVCVAIIALLIGSGAMPAGAQLTRGFISGIVTDPSNAILPGVQVTITNRATNISRETLTNDVGLYRFVAVEPGTYAVEFKLPGFETRRIAAITVSTAQEV